MSVLNTCTVTQKSEQKARRIIRLMLEKFPQAVILVTGCYAQLNSEEILQIDNARIVFRNLRGEASKYNKDILIEEFQ